MNRYVVLRRMRGPLILVTIGVLALLDQYNVVQFGQSWPVILIVIGVLMLAERAALAQSPPPPGEYYPDGCWGMRPPVAPVPPAAGENATQSQEQAMGKD